MNCPEPYAITTNDNDNNIDNDNTTANISFITPTVSTSNMFIIKPFVLNISTEVDVLSYTTDIAITDPAILTNKYNISVPRSKNHPCIIRLTLNDHIVDMKIPHLADIDSYKLQISRKSSKLVPTLPTLHRPFKNCFPMIKEGDSKTNQSHWLILLGRMQSTTQDREDESRGITTSALFSFKRSIHSILLRLTGSSTDSTKQYKWYGFKLHEHIQMIMHVNAIRLNASVGSVVMDAAIAIVNDTNRRNILAFYSEMARTGQAANLVLTDNDEWTVWKNMIPVLNERCRSGWKHGRNCKYMEYDNSSSVSPPARQQSQQHLTNCHCHCGLGEGHQGTDFESNYKKANVFPNFIRIALSPLFPVEELTYNNNSSGSPIQTQNTPRPQPVAAPPVSSASSAVQVPVAVPASVASS
eukprot:gene3014-5905_t